MVRLGADFGAPEAGSRRGPPLLGIIFEPLTCGGYSVCARVPTFLGIVEHDAVFYPLGNWVPECGEEHRTPTEAPGRSQGEQGVIKLGRRRRSPGGEE